MTFMRKRPVEINELVWLRDNDNDEGKVTVVGPYTVIGVRDTSKITNDESILDSREGLIGENWYHENDLLPLTLRLKDLSDLNL